MIKCKDTGEIFQTYKDYLKSEHWKKVKLRYKESKLPHFCVSCGKKQNLDMHHKTYERIGNEHLCDLVHLYRDCHQLTHDTMRVTMVGKLKNAHNRNRMINKKQFMMLWKIDMGKKVKKKHIKKLGLCDFWK